MADDAPSNPTASSSSLSSLPPLHPLLSPGPSLNDFCYDISTLQALARQGSWRSVSEKIYHARKLSLLQFPHEQLVYHAYLILSHMKLRNYGAAADEFDALGDLDSPKYRYEHHPSLYPGKTGSLMPFALRWLHAELPHRIGQTSETIERLYRLLNHCREHLDRVLVHDDPRQTAGETIAVIDKDQKGRRGFDKGASLESSGLDQVSPPSRNIPFKSIDSNNDSFSALSTDVEVDPSTQGISHRIPDGPYEGATNEIIASPEALSVGFSGLSVEPDNTLQHGAHTSGLAKEGIRNNLCEQGKYNSLPSPGSDHEFGEFVSGTIPISENMDTLKSSIPNVVFTSAGSAVERWQRREEFIVNTILSHHITQKEFVLGLKWLKQMLRKCPNDPVLHSKLAYVQMQLGDLTGAKDTLSKVENIVSQAAFDPLSTTRLKGLVSRNRGLQYVVTKQYVAAIKEFDAAIEFDPTDVLSANNKALCLMYCKDLIGSTKVLETILEKQPVVALNESLVLNLCSMYELAFVNNVGVKKSLTDWIMKVAPDDFDLSCTRL